MHFKTTLRTPVLIALIFCSTYTQATEITQGTMLSNSCAGCHGTDGKSPGAIPSINGKSTAYISTSLMEFRSGKRPSTVMGRHAKGYTDKEIKLIAEHFSNL